MAYGFFKINNRDYSEAKKLFDKAENIDPKRYKYSNGNWPNFIWSKKV